MLIMFWSKTPKTNNINPKLNICVIKTDKDGNKSWLYGKNRVTNDGDIYYASRAGVAPSNASIALPDPNFYTASCVLQNPSSADTITKSDGATYNYNNVSNPILNTTIPVGQPNAGTVNGNAVKAAVVVEVNNQTAENTGRDVDAVTYKFTWTTAEINTGQGNPITGGCIVDTADVSSGVPASASKLLTHWNFVSPSSFHKTNTDTLTLYVNHTMSGQA